MPLLLSSALFYIFTPRLVDLKGNISTGIEFISATTCFEYSSHVLSSSFSCLEKAGLFQPFCSRENRAHSKTIPCSCINGHFIRDLLMLMYP